TPGIGFAIGIERIMELVQMPEKSREGWYLGAMLPEAVEKLLELAHQQRKAGEKTVVEYTPKSLKAHLKGADKVGARYCAVIGEDELSNGTIWVKDLEEKCEKVVPLTEFF
uniref:His/Gly/Thr/Pro-type tRNA ligase C-terminal domain-containing protein n=1 Tax=Nitratifractor sp. TaxID=2268144 RepID=UPI0025FB6501